MNFQGTNISAINLRFNIGLTIGTDTV